MFSVVPLKALLGTLLIFVLFISLFVTYLLMSAVKDAEWMFVPLIIGFGLALLKCIQNIREIIDIKDEDATETNKKVKLKTCPEYWIKDLIYVQESDGTYNKLSVCKNYFPSAFKKDTTLYVGGFNNSNNDNNFNFINNITINEGVSNMEELQNLAIGLSVESNVDSTTTNTNESFTVDEPSKYIHVDELRNPLNTNSEYNNGFNIKYGVDSGNDDELDKVIYLGNVNSNEALSNQTQTHIHYRDIHSIHKGNYSSETISHDKDSLIFNSNNSNLTGMVWHKHKEYPLPYEDSINSANADKWIFFNPNTADGESQGVILNLDQLNNTSNICELSKNFYWVEAYNKCTKAGKW